MAIVFSYPPIGKNDVQPSDRLLLSQMTVDGNPTRSVTVNTLRQYLGAIIPTNIVTGTGTTNRLTKWKAPVGSGVIEDSSIEDTGSEINVPYKFNVNNATSNANGIVFPHPAGGASGIVNMYYNGAAAGSRFVISRAATGGAEIELESSGNVNINRQGNGNFFVGGEVTLDDYGSGAITGTPTFNLEVDANGKIIETASGGVTGTGVANTVAIWDSGTNLTNGSIPANGFYYYPATGRVGLGTTSPNFRMDIGGGDLRMEENFGILFGGTGSNHQNFMIYTTGDPFGGNYPGTWSVGMGNRPGSLANPALTVNRVNPGADGQITFNKYGSGTFTGTAAFGLSVDANGNIIETASAVAGYKSVQVFQWPNGTPVAYTNWTNGVASNIPFNATPLVETGTYSGTAANFAWTCVNNAGGTATQEAQFTLGANGAGTWQIDTCQHWFDQTNQVEIRVSFQFTSGGVTQQIDVIDEKSTELSGDKIFYGSLVREFVATDKIEVEVEFVSGGVNPFPSDSGNRPIEITFTKLV